MTYKPTVRLKQQRAKCEATFADATSPLGPRPCIGEAPSANVFQDEHRSRLLLSETSATTAIGVICKAPKPGASKTRLIPKLGAERAAALSRAFLIDLSSVIVAVGQTHAACGYAVCSPASAAEDLAAFLPPSFGYLVETDSVLGGVLARSASALLARGHASVILVNGDSPTLPCRPTSVRSR